MLFKDSDKKVRQPAADSGIGNGDSGSSNSDEVVSSGTVGESVLINHGIHAKSFPVVGMTVSQARRTLSSQLNVDPQAVAVIRGEIVENEDTRVIQSVDQMVSFVKKSSIKGAGCCRSHC